MAFLDLINVSKSFGAFPVLKDVNLSLGQGEFVAIVGFSGAGKTTLLNLIAGLQRPDSGTVKLNDLEITAPGPDRVVVFQNYSLLPWRSHYSADRWPGGHPWSLPPSRDPSSTRSQGD